MHSGAQVIIVTDDAALARDVAEALGRAGIECVHATTDHAIGLAATNPPPAVALVDPRDGRAARAITGLRKARDPSEMAVLALEIGSARKEVDGALDAGAEDFVAWPMDPSRLKTRLGVHLRRREVSALLERKARDSRLLVEITARLVSGHDVLDSLYEVAHTLARELDVDRCSVVLVRPERDYGFVVASSDDPAVRSLPIDLRRYPEIESAVSSGKPLVIDDVENADLLQRVLPTLRTARVSSVALFPIAKDGATVGVIFLRFRERRERFDERELTFCQTVANATAIAVRNAEILDSLKAKTLEAQRAHIEAQGQIERLSRYRSFFMSAVDGMMVIDDASVVVFLNDEAARLIGEDERLIRGRPFTEFLEPSERSRFHAVVEDFVSGRVRRAVDFRRLAGNESERVLSISAAPLFDERGMILLNLRDVTEERSMGHRLAEAHERAVASEKRAAMVELAGAAAHEFNQPLTSVLASLAMLRRLVPADGAAGRAIDTLEQETERMAGIVRRLGRITQYATKEYVGESRIIDLDRACGEGPEGEKR